MIANIQLRTSKRLIEPLRGKESYKLSCSSLNLSSSSFAGSLDVDKYLLGQGFDNIVMHVICSFDDLTNLGTL